MFSKRFWCVRATPAIKEGALHRVQVARICQIWAPVAEWTVSWLTCPDHRYRSYRLWRYPFVGAWFQVLPSMSPATVPPKAHTGGTQTEADATGECIELCIKRMLEPLHVRQLSVRDLFLFFCQRRPLVRGNTSVLTQAQSGS